MLSVFGVVSGLLGVASCKNGETPIAVKTPSEKPENAQRPTPNTNPLPTPDTRHPDSLSGILLAESRAAISVRLPAKIVAVRVKEGQRVNAKELLVLLDDSDFVSQEKTAVAGVGAARAQLDKAVTGKAAQRLKADTDLATAEAGLKTAQTKLAQAKLAKEALAADTQTERTLADESVKKAELGLQTAQKTLASLESLNQVGGVSRNDLESARTGVRIAQSDLDTAKAQRHRLDNAPYPKETHSFRLALAQKDVEAAQEGVAQARAGVGQAKTAKVQLLRIADSDIAAARAAVSQAEAGRTGADTARAQSRLTAPVAGTVSNLVARVGEIAQPGVPLLTIVAENHGRTQVESLVTARVLARLKLGRSALITSDFLPGRKLPAILTALAHTAESDGRTFRVRFTLNEPVHADLPPGATVFIQMSSTD